mgnify:CR=1 FL=1
MSGETNYYEELSQLMEEYPELVFCNDGYENIPIEVREANADGIAKVEKLLKVAIKDFVYFQNFKPRKDGSTAVRCQTKWDHSFTGVSYFPLENFRPGHPSWENSDA